MDLLLAALDCYNTFIHLQIIKPHQMLSSEGKSSFLKRYASFVTELSTQELAAAESCFPLAKKTSHFSPREVDQFQLQQVHHHCPPAWSFTTMILVKGDQSFGSFWSKTCFSLRVKISRNSVEELCSVDLYQSSTVSRHDQMEMVLSSCTQILKADFLSSILHSQDATYAQSLGSRLLMTVYKGISTRQQSEQLVDLLLNTIMLSVPISGCRSNRFLSFSHGEYFYSLFQVTINTELLRSLNTQCHAS
ncbi:hypothetical protein KUCAC02_017327 [Chaenocephalus aceratus]|uniref:Uncharacterized protein n=1 Tax=Chaenocephalus aceratus TaxID=36190 RepID=A0ACB9W286_CHAAC|nr:hypothetical protein KUCAC02_017327 [Chaenocephalus aceratus]